MAKDSGAESERTENGNQLNAFLFTTPAVSQAFSAAAQLRAMMRFEWALVRALESCGLSEAGSGAVLERLLDAGFVDGEGLERGARLNGNIAIPFVQQLTAAVKARNEGAARAIHLGATSQDVLDTALVLQAREAWPSIEAGIDRLANALARQVRAHGETVLAGRTWLQTGPPTTLGLKLAGTLAALTRHRARLDAAAKRFQVLEFGGAVGTLAALGEKGMAVTGELARLLELEEPDLPWHTQRDNVAEVVQVLALLTGSLAKFARDIALLMQSEVGEAAEGGEGERGGSSTMPHKRNPVACAAVLANHAAMPALAATMLAAMPQEHERGLGLWQAEWETVPEAFRRAAAALDQAAEIAERLEVNPARMQANLDALLGLPMAEAVSVALTAKMGRAQAHELIRKASADAAREQRSLADVLKRMPEVTEHFSAAAMDDLVDPRRYLGRARQFIERVLEAAGQQG